MANRDKKNTDVAKASNARQRRALLKKLGRFAAVSAPTVTLLLAAKAKPGAAAVSCTPTCFSRTFKDPGDGKAVLAAAKSLRVTRT